MRIIKKIIFFIVLIILVISTIGLRIYFKNVSGDFSSKSEEYSNFRSYIGGTLTPLLSLLSILIIYYIHLNDKAQIRGQIDEQRNLHQVNLYQDKIDRIKLDIDRILGLEIYP